MMKTLVNVSFVTLFATLAVAKPINMFQRRSCDVDACYNGVMSVIQPCVANLESQNAQADVTHIDQSCMAQLQLDGTHPIPVCGGCQSSDVFESPNQHPKRSLGDVTGAAGDAVVDLAGGVDDLAHSIGTGINNVVGFLGGLIS